MEKNAPGSHMAENKRSSFQPNGFASEAPRRGHRLPCASLASPTETSPSTNAVGLWTGSPSPPPQPFPLHQLQKFGAWCRQPPEITRTKPRENRADPAKRHCGGSLGFSRDSAVLHKHPRGPALFLAQFLCQNGVIKENAAPRSRPASAWPTVSSPGEDKA